MNDVHIQLLGYVRPPLSLLYRKLSNYAIAKIINVPKTAIAVIVFSHISNVKFLLDLCSEDICNLTH